jgi:hemerythrin
MNKFIWTEKYSVGVKTIDEQHKRFFEIANSIVDLEEKDASREELLAALGQLGDYALYHLNTEEKYFDELHYADAERHVAIHNQYREKIKDYFEKARNEKTDIKELAKEIASYSNDWLSYHILIMDKQYTKFFIEHGLK